MSTTAQVFVFLVGPLVLIYIGLLVWSCKRDQWPR
jgi:hypothetical protein